MPAEECDASIIRAESRDRYTVVHNETVEDGTLSFRALGLLVYILSKPDHWRTHVSQLASTRETGEGREAVRTALKELERAGYVERRWERADGDDTPKMRYLIHERPMVRTARPGIRNAGKGAGQTGCPETGHPDNWAPRNRHAQEPASSNTYKEEVITDLEQTDARATTAESLLLIAEATPASPSLTFQDFWNVYPIKRDRGHAEGAWNKAVKAAGGDVALIVDAARRYRDDPNRTLGYTKYGQGWLNGKCWEDEPLPSRIDRRSAAAPARPIDTDRTGPSGRLKV